MPTLKTILSTLLLTSALLLILIATVPAMLALAAVEWCGDELRG